MTTKPDAKAAIWLMDFEVPCPGPAGIDHELGQHPAMCVEDCKGPTRLAALMASLPKEA